jgi:hypothetical protein
VRCGISCKAEHKLELETGFCCTFVEFIRYVLILFQEEDEGEDFGNE